MCVMLTGIRARISNRVLARIATAASILRHSLIRNISASTTSNMSSRDHLYGHPAKLLFRLPSPPQAYFPSSSTPVSGVSSSQQPTESHPLCRLRSALGDERTLEPVVRKLSLDLRRCHPKQVRWPIEENLRPLTIHDYHRDVLVSPVVQLFCQLCACFLKPLQCKMHTVDGVSIITFHADDFKYWKEPVRTPILVFIEQDSLRGQESLFTMPPGLSTFLHRAWEIDTDAKVICSDLDSLLVFHPPSSPASHDVVYERIRVGDNLSTLRILIAAYLYDALPEDMYIDVPLPRDTFESIIPQGAQIKPTTPMQPLKEVVATHHRHSDFDFYTLTRDRDRALQFFQWKDHIKDNVSPQFARSGDILHGITKGFVRLYPELVPYYPTDELPSELVEHIQSFQRLCPMTSILEMLSPSEIFSLKLLKDLTPEFSGGLCRTFTCRIVSIDGRDFADDMSPMLCVKLFDDRFYPMEPPDEGLMKAGLRWWWMRYIVAEERVRSEDAAYKKLKFMQGSLIPRFYGSHSFTLPDGHEVYGILMEYVPAPSLSEGVAGTLPREQQVELIQSTRHAIRALQYADVSQHDWHSGQILCNTVTSSDNGKPAHVHCVLIDFSATTQSVEELIPHREDDFGDCLRVLCDPEVGLEGRVVWQHFGTREPWDLITSSVMIDGAPKWTRASDPFDFIYEH